MDREEKNYKLLTQGDDGKITEKRITQEELGQIFFGEGNRKWDQVQLVLPKPEWEKIYEDGYLIYEGYTLDHKAFGAGRAFFKNGMPCLEGVFGFKGLVSGKAYYSNGVIRFEGIFRINHGYGPNFPEYGIWYDVNGKLLFRGKFGVARSSLGWPRVYEPEGFGSVPASPLGIKHQFMWEDVKRLMKGQKGTD